MTSALRAPPSVVAAAPRVYAGALTMNHLFDIIYEDAGLLVVNKPADLVCHPTKGDVYSSLISRARLHLGEGVAPQLVNRLDRETSGLVLVAKDAAAALELRRAWEQGAVTKEYAAIVHGWPAAERGEITAPLGRDEASRVAIKDCVRADGAAARTTFAVERRFERAAGRFALLHVVTATGRKHQIRIHLAHLGHPLVGDKLYGGDEDCYLALVERRLTAEQRSRLLLPNHALHAGWVSLVWRAEPRVFAAPPEPWFLEFLQDGVSREGEKDGGRTHAVERTGSNAETPSGASQNKTATNRHSFQ